MAEEQKLYKKRYDKLIGGVCSGLADYFDIDPTIMRLGFVLLTFATYSAMIIAYIVLWFVLPYDVPDRTGQTQTKRKDYSRNDNSYGSYENEKREDNKNYAKNNKEKSEKSTSVLGIILVVLGLMLFVRHIIPSYLLDDFIIPICLLVGGIGLIVTSSSRKKKGEYYIQPDEEEFYQDKQDPFEEKEEAVDAYVYEEVKVEEDNVQINYEIEDDNAKSLEESFEEKEETPDVIILPYEGDDNDIKEVDDNVNKTYIDITRHQLNKEAKENSEDFDKGEGEKNE